MKKAILRALLALVFILSTTAIVAALEPYQYTEQQVKAVEICKQLGGNEYFETAAISGVEEMVCYFAGSSDCGENQLINGNCPVKSVKQVRTLKSCSELGGNAKEKIINQSTGEREVYCDFGDLGECDQGEISGDTCEVDNAWDTANARCNVLGGSTLITQHPLTKEQLFSCVFDEKECSNEKILSGECGEIDADGEDFIEKCQNYLGGDVTSVSKIPGAGYVPVCAFGVFASCDEDDVRKGLCEVLPSKFDDIKGNKYEDAIRYVEHVNVVRGYVDGTYRPDDRINRAEFTKVVVSALYEQAEYGANPLKTESCFPDVEANLWYTEFICFAKSKGIVNGHASGEFKPGDFINYAEGLKIILEAYEMGNFEPENNWYEAYVAFANSGALSFAGNIKPGDELTRGQVAEIIYWLDFFKP